LRRQVPGSVVSMVVEVGEQFAVSNQLLIEPGALLRGQVLEDLLSHAESVAAVARS
jgi:hypothetical protein